MKNIFSKFIFPETPDGNLYEWKGAETLLIIPQAGLFAIKIVASAENAKQNNSSDDDDLRIAIDGFSFGKYEIHDEKISWKGFGTSASWDGASLKGGTKTIYFFMELDKGEHKIQFFADKTPRIKSIEVFEVEDNDFTLTALKPPEKIESRQKGIPWLSFIFFGSHIKNILLDVNTRSAKEKGTTDGDNLKVVVNGKILQNKKASTSRKYKNFYFSGDIKSSGILSILDKDLSAPFAFENSVELWYDEKPELTKLQISFFDTETSLEELKPLIDLRKYVLRVVNLSLFYFRYSDRIYSEKFLKHSLEKNPQSIEFRSNHPIVRKIKADPVYAKIRKTIKGRLDNGILEGEFYPKDFNFTSFDLATSIHGVKKIEYRAREKRNGDTEVYFELYDIYDFERGDTPFFLFNVVDYFKQQIVNLLDAGEELGIISSFEVVIHVKDIF